MVARVILKSICIVIGGEMSFSEANDIIMLCFSIIHKLSLFHRIIKASYDEDIGKDKLVDILGDLLEKDDSASTNMSTSSLGGWGGEEEGLVVSEEAGCDGNCNWRCSGEEAPKFLASIEIEA